MVRIRAAVLAVCAASAFVVLSALVDTHVTHGIDAAARWLFRPHDEWGDTQIRADVVVEGFKPRNILLLLPVIAVGSSIWRRSWRPAAYGALIGVSLVALTLLSKLAIQRADPHGLVVDHGGSFPSGHTVSVLVCVGGALLILRERPRWWEWSFVGLAGAVMGWALLVQAAHWLTDVVGGALLAVTLLALLSMSRLRWEPDGVGYRRAARLRRRGDEVKNSADSSRN